MTTKPELQRDDAENAQPVKAQYPKLPQDDLPTTEVLASIAGIVSKDFENNADLAVNHALNLWRSAKRQLEQELQEIADEAKNMDLYQEVVNAAQVELERTGKLKWPKKYPATFREFLFLMVKGKTVADKTAQFRKYLKSVYGGCNFELQMADILKNGFKTSQDWFNTAEQYHQWYAVRLSELAKHAAEEKKNRKNSSRPSTG